MSMALVLGMAPCAAGQVFINEILENPPGGLGIDVGWEYVELLGYPGAPLDGYALLLLKGGVDDNRDGMPEIEPHVDEFHPLDGLTLDENGLLCIYGAEESGTSPLAERFFRANATYDPSRPESPSNRRWRGAIGARSISERAGSASKLSDRGSSTYLLVRRPVRNEAGYARWRAGLRHDANFDGVVDSASGAQPLEPLQVVDEIAWSHRGGREYARSHASELSETRGLNPDAVTRVYLWGPNPERGHRTRDVLDARGHCIGFTVESTSTADESFVYGIIDGWRFPHTIAYFDGCDAEGWRQFYAPTDPGATPYPLLDRDPEPDSKPFGAVLRAHPHGILKLRDLPLAGMSLTPGAINRDPTLGFSQVVPLRGDVDFDGDVNAEDVRIVRGLLGASAVDRLAVAVPGDAGVSGAVAFRFEGWELRQLLAAAAVSDDAEGEDEVVTDADVRVVLELASLADRPDTAP